MEHTKKMFGKFVAERDQISQHNAELISALRRLIRLHELEVFVFGEDDADVVEHSIKNARAAIAKATQS